MPLPQFVLLFVDDEKGEAILDYFYDLEFAKKNMENRLKLYHSLYEKNYKIKKIEYISLEK